MATKRRQRLALMAKMRRLQTKQKGKQKVHLDCEHNCEEENEPHEGNAPFVTFVEEFEELISDEVEEEGMSPTIAQQRPHLDRVQFYLDNGRVDVAEVFQHLNATGLQFESKPGIWRDLRGMRTGKSANKFKNMQQVNIKRTGLTNWWPSRAPGPWVDSWLVEGDTRKIYCVRVSRLSCETGGESGGKVVGTAIRFENPYGLLLTAHHCCTFTDPMSGKLLTRNDLCAYNTSVEVVHLSDKYDLAFLLLKSGPYVGGFRLATRGEEKRGREVRMLSFPWHVDRAFGFDHDSIGPTEVHGHIANLGPEERKLPLFVDSLATYMGGFAASPGGAVTINSKVLVGMHIRAIWHQKGEMILPYREHKKRSPRGGYQDCSTKENFGGETSNQRKLLKGKKRKMAAQGNNYYEEDPQTSRCPYGGTSTQRKSLRGKKRRVAARGNDFYEENSQTSCSYGETSSSRQNARVSHQEPCKSNTQTKCSMYHGYLSTYLSASRIQEEYNEFVSFWRMGNFSKKAIRSEVDRFQYIEEDNHPRIKRRK